MKRIHRLDLKGAVFGKWVVLKAHDVNARGEVFWLCRCECGTEAPVRAGNLRGRRSISCGCHRIETITTHGMTGTPTFRSWVSMKQRCLNPKAPDYKRYGGRGIKVHGSWVNSFEQFLHDMGERPSGKTLDRVDCDGDYDPGNCRWATLSRQQRNRRDTPRLTHNGKTLALADWAELTGIPPSILQWRTMAGWSPEATLTTPVRHRRGRKRHARE